MVDEKDISDLREDIMDAVYLMLKYDIDFNVEDDNDWQTMQYLFDKYAHHPTEDRVLNTKELDQHRERIDWL